MKLIKGFSFSLEKQNSVSRKCNSNRSLSNENIKSVTKEMRDHQQLPSWILDFAKVLLQRQERIQVYNGDGKV